MDPLIRTTAPSCRLTVAPSPPPLSWRPCDATLMRVCVCVCEFGLCTVHNRQTDTESDRGHDPSQQGAHTVAPCLFSVILVRFWMCVCVCVCVMLDVRAFFFLFVFCQVCIGVVWESACLKTNNHTNELVHNYAITQKYKSPGGCRALASH